MVLPPLAVCTNFAAIPGTAGTGVFVAVDVKVGLKVAVAVHVALAGVVAVVVGVSVFVEVGEGVSLGAEVSVIKMIIAVAAGAGVLNEMLQARLAAMSTLVKTKTGFFMDGSL